MNVEKVERVQMKSKKIAFELPKGILKYFLITAAVLVFVAYASTAAKFGLKDFAVIIAFILIGAAARLPQRFAPVSIGIELVSLFTIVSAIKYGIFAGALVGAASFLISGYFTIERPQDILIAIIGFIGIAYFAPISYSFFGANLGLVAIALTLGYDIFTNSFYFFMGHGLIGIIRFSVVHLISNYFIISYLGAKLIGF